MRELDVKEEAKQIPASSAVIFLILIVLAVLCVLIPGGRLAKRESYSTHVQALNETKMGVEKLAGSAAAASAAITLMPGDFGTPIADKLADLSGYFLIILCAVYIEKFLVTVSGILAFDLLIPIGLILLAVGRLLALPPELKKIGVRIIALGLILYALVPVSLKVSGMIENQYAAEIQEVIDSANQNTEELRGTADRSDDSSIWSEFTEKIKGGSSTLLNRLETILSTFIDAIAIYIVTTCVIPIAVLLIALWAIRLLFHVDIGVKISNIPHMSEYTAKGFRHRRKEGV